MIATRRLILTRALAQLLASVFVPARTFHAQTKPTWRAASPTELEAALPARAPVDKERIESEMRTASGVINARGELFAAVLLITAGYSAEGKYSHYLLVQHTVTLGENLRLTPGAYVVGWSHADDGLKVHVFEAATVKERGTLLARPIPQARRVEPFRIWPPAEHSYLQIGRYMIPYHMDE